MTYDDGSVEAIDTWCPADHKTNVLDSDQVCMCMTLAAMKVNYLYISYVTYSQIFISI